MKRLMVLMAAVFTVFALCACGGGSGGGSDHAAADIVVPPSVEVPDDTAPYVLSTIPEINGTAGINSAITVTFNEPINPATITLNSILLDDADGIPVDGAVAYDAASRTATFHPDADLVPEENYKATVTTAIEDLAGIAMEKEYSWEFTTGNADTTPPEISSRFPAKDANSVALNTVIAVTFSEPIDLSTLNTQTLTLNGTALVDGTVEYVGTTALFKPAANLMPNTVYTVSVAETIEDLAGNALGAPEEWEFTTGTQADLVAPQALSVYPQSGAINVPTDSVLEVEFDEAIMPFEFGIIDDRPVTVTFNENYTIATLMPTDGLGGRKIYTAQIKVADMAGNFMDEIYAWRFATDSAELSTTEN